MKSWCETVIAIALALIAPERCVAGTAEMGETPEPWETKDRLSPSAMKEMVAVPMAVVRADGLAAGRARFEELRKADEARHGPASVRIADLTEAFGVELHMEWMLRDDPALLHASRDYLDAAISAYRAAFGPADAEVAVALHSFAEVDIMLNDGRLTPRAENAFEEALQIRRSALGPQDHETLATEERLSSLKGGPSELEKALGDAADLLKHAKDRARD